MRLELFDWLVLDEWALAILLAIGAVLGLLVRAAFVRTGDQSEYVCTTWAVVNTKINGEKGDNHGEINTGEDHRDPL